MLGLLAPLNVGDELLPGVVLVAASTELGPRLTFEVDGEDLHIDVAPRSDDRPSAAQSRRLMFSYRTQGGAAKLDPRVAFETCRAVAARALDTEDSVLDEVASGIGDTTGGGSARMREVAVSRLLERAGAPHKRHYTLSPYVGCLIGCRFCYAQERVGISRRLEGLPDTRWGSYVDVRINAPEVLAHELVTLGPSPLKFCPIVSDPYQAVEKRYSLTRRCLEVIAGAALAHPTLVLTRSDLVLRDLDVLATLPDVRVGVSLPSVDDDVCRHFEPRAAPASVRLEMLSELAHAGIRTFAVVQPILPGSIRALADALAGVVESVSIDVLHGEQGAAKDFDVPEFRVARADAWQLDRARELLAELERRRIPVWGGDLPPDLLG